MRATKWSSIIGGLGFGLLIRFSAAGHISSLIPVLAFFFISLVAVVGVPQIQDAYSLQHKLGSWAFWQTREFYRHCITTAGRMLLFFISTVVAAEAAAVLSA